MNNDLIRRSDLKEELHSWAICINRPQCYSVEDADYVIDTMPAVDAVPMAAYEQIRWERDIAMQQLEDHGIPFGGKAPDVVRVVRCKDCKNSGMYCFGYSDTLQLACLDIEEDGFIRAAASVNEDDFCSSGERRKDNGR